VGHSPQVERPDEFVRLLVAAARRSPLMRLRTWWWRLRHSKGSPPVPGPEGAGPPRSPVSPAAGVDGDLPPAAT
jgi:hypothetical protein